MNRRDFLLLRTEGSSRIAELSCEKLFMHYQDLNSGFQQALEEAGTPGDADWWAGEPPLNISRVEPEHFFRDVLHQLDDIEKISVRDMEWLDQGDFRIRVETLLAAFKARGGEVSFAMTTRDNSREA